MFVKPGFFLLCALLLATPAFAHDGSSIDTCGAHSDYDLNLSDRSISFSSSHTSPHAIELRQGHLWVDGKEQALSAADQERIVKLEAGTRQVLGQFREIALDAADIALDAVESVAVALSTKDTHQQQLMHDRLAHARDELRRGIDSRIQGTGWSDADIGAVVESSVKSLLPTVVAQVTADAVRMALSGDEAAAKEFGERADQLGRDIEARVEARAKTLERRADALCPQIAQLGSLAASLDLRIEGRYPLPIFTR